MTNRRFKFIGSVLLTLLLISCPSPLSSSRFGQVIIDFNPGSRMARASSIIPATVARVEVNITGKGFNDIALTLSAPNLNATLDIPSGPKRTFTVRVLDENGKPLFLGQKVIDIEAGSVNELAILLETLYSLSYDANGAEGGMVPPPSFATEGTKLIIPSNTGSLTRAGFAFSGWNSSADLLGTSYAVSQVLSMPSANLLLYASWQAASYAITYHLNGGTNVPANPTSYTAASAAIALADPTWGANLFQGWFTDAALTSPISLIPSGSTGNLDLYAKWNVLSFNVNFNKDGGSGFMAAQSIPNGATVSLSTNTYTKLGYTFEGWAYTSGGAMAIPDAGSYTMGGADITLYAVWTPISYTVIFDPNTGTGSMAPQNFNFDSSMPLTPYSFSRVGYSFEGWGLNPAGPVVYADMAPFTMNVPGQMLFAQWTPINYTVFYNANGATVGSVPSSQNGNYGASVTVLPPNVSPTFAGPLIQDGIRQVFSGWNTAPGGGGTPYSPGASLIMPAASVTLYAQFTTTPTVINKIGPAGGWVFYDKGSVSNGWRYLEVEPTSHAGAPYWSDVTGTAIGDTGTAIGEGAFNSLKIITQAMHTGSAAKTADDFSSSYNSVTYTDWYLPSTNELNEAFAVLAPANIGAGAYWSSTEGGAGSANCPAQANPTHNVVKNQAGYPFRATRAFATGPETFVILYEANGALVGTAPVDLMHYSPGAAVTLSGDNGLTDGTIPPTKWNTQANGLGADYAIGGPLTMPPNNLVLYAKW
ncbi:hypothetical protein MASR2M78_19410 [Treponema sp.]